MNGEKLVAVLTHMARVIEANKDRLCELDSDVGDGDHGVSMTIGMRAARRALAQLSSPTPQIAFRVVGDAFGDEVGASSGVLYEVSFAAAADAIGSDSTLKTTAQWRDIFQAIAGAIHRTGHAELGDKTMYDAWQPAAEAVAEAARQGDSPVMALKMGAAAAENGVLKTKDLIPKKGRASLLGERARGYQDAGATSAWLIVQALSEGVRDAEGSN